MTGVLTKNYSTRQLPKIVCLQSNNQDFPEYRKRFQKSYSLNSRKAVMTHVISRQGISTQPTDCCSCVVSFCQRQRANQNQCFVDFVYVRPTVVFQTEDQTIVVVRDGTPGKRDCRSVAQLCAITLQVCSCFHFLCRFNFSSFVSYMLCIFIIIPKCIKQILTRSGSEYIL